MTARTDRSQQTDHVLADRVLAVHVHRLGHRIGSVSRVRPKTLHPREAILRRRIDEVVQVGGRARAARVDPRA